MRRFEGEVALVTGAAWGIGLAIATRLLAEGGHVFLADIDGDEARRAIDRLPGDDASRASAVTLDITDEAACRLTVASIKERHGRLGVLVNNAAIGDRTPIGDLTIEHFRKVTRVTLDGALACTLAALPLMERSGGRILMTASIMGLVGAPDSLPYSSAKGGLVNMVRALACDLASRGITVNAIAPGFIDSRMSRFPDGSSQHDTEVFRTVYLKHRKIPLGRAGCPDDLAGPAAFLVSSDAAYITGRSSSWTEGSPPHSDTHTMGYALCERRSVSSPAPRHEKSAVGRAQGRGALITVANFAGGTTKQFELERRVGAVKSPGHVKHLEPLGVRERPQKSMLSSEPTIGPDSWKRDVNGHPAAAGFLRSADTLSISMMERRPKSRSGRRLSPAGRHTHPVRIPAPTRGIFARARAQDP